tara:strand:+ start:1518 stop:1760 length:243 start_codon:yes stop_codon:yes gene_type:complete
MEEFISQVILDIITELAVLIIKRAKLEKKIKKCISCTIKNLFSCCNGDIHPKKELVIVNDRINELENEINRKNSYKETMI